MTEDEKVLVFPADKLGPYLPHFSGGVATDPYLVEDLLDDVLWPGAAFYHDRASAEADPSVKQVIPYCVLTKPVARLAGVRDGRAVTAESAHYFAYRRTKKGGESRLHDRWSVGVGGHINPCDGAPADYGSRDAGGFGYDGEFYGPYAAALRRELLEEVGLSLPDDLSRHAPVRAVIYDDSNDVGRVHFGVVHLVRVGGGFAVTSGDPALSNGAWMSLEGLAGTAGEYFEPWSRKVIERVLPAA